MVTGVDLVALVHTYQAPEEGSSAKSSNNESHSHAFSLREPPHPDGHSGDERYALTER